MVRKLWGFALTALAAATLGCPGAPPGGGGNTNANRNTNGNANANTNRNTNANANDNTGGNQNANANVNGNVNANDNAAGEARNFTATLDTEQEVPPPTGAVTAQGEGEFTLSADGSEIEYRVTASGLSGPVTVAHFHEAPPGVAGPIVIDISADITEVGGEVVIEGSAAADEDFVTALLAGDIYVNLHTALNPAGEIRGQLEEDGPGPDL